MHMSTRSIILHLPLFNLMKTKTICSLVIFSFLTVAPVFADDMKDGIMAFHQKDYKTALKKWKPLAQEGNLTAQNNLGVIFNRGLGVKRNPEEAVKWFNMAAMNGEANAQYHLGKMHYEGKGIPRNDKEAMKWLMMSSKKGNGKADFQIGLMVEAGHGAKQDNKEATKWYTKSAEKGYAKAQRILGLKHRDGAGVSKNIVTARMWLNIAGSYGSEEALKEGYHLKKEMTPDQVAESDKLTREWLEKRRPKKK
jgi:TPR repeat protein